MAMIKLCELSGYQQKHHCLVVTPAWLSLIQHAINTLQQKMINKEHNGIYWWLEQSHWRWIYIGKRIWHTLKNYSQSPRRALSKNTLKSFLSNYVVVHNWGQCWLQPLDIFFLTVLKHWKKIFKNKLLLSIYFTWQTSLVLLASLLHFLLNLEILQLKFLPVLSLKHIVFFII